MKNQNKNQQLMAMVSTREVVKTIILNTKYFGEDMSDAETRNDMDIISLYHIPININLKKVGM